jgi:uroporphyrinogen decarboxylase
MPVAVAAGVGAVAGRTLGGHMELTRRERVRGALRQERVDRLPSQLHWTAAMGARLAEHFRVDASALPARFDNHLVRVDLTHEGRLSADGRIRRDWWGAGFDTAEEGYFVAHHPLAERADLDAFAWPEPWEPGLLADASRIRAGVGDDAFVVPNLGFALFERAWSLRGFENLFMDLASDQGFVEALLDRITEIQLVLVRRYIDLGVDGGYFGDDYGAQAGLLFSPTTWRRLIKPRLARLFAPFLERGLPVLMHSDGRIEDIVPDLVEIGLTALNPVQPEVLDHSWLRSTFGDRLAFYGGVSTQTVLPRGTPAEVRQAVGLCRERLAPEGTGLLLAPSHRLMSDVPMANVEALLAAFAEPG